MSEPLIKQINMINYDCVIFRLMLKEVNNQCNQKNQINQWFRLFMITVSGLKY
jgi:hypothetical protein